MNRYNLKHASLQKRREPIKLEPKQWSKVYKKVYKIIGKKTPLYGDCGLLCQKACCQGDWKDGMLLFPGEEVIFMKGPVASYFSLTPVTIKGTADPIKAVFAVCNGTCPRKYRPLSCRIFHFLPIIDASGAVEVIKDPRASICPLVHLEEEDFHGVSDPSFKDSIYEAFDYLIQYPGIREFLDAIYHNAKEVKLIRDLFTGKNSI